MAISYPLALPTINGISNVNFSAINAVAYSASAFTFAGQAHAYAGQMWQAEISLPAMKRSKAETWISFLMSLRGQFGTFLLGDPRACALRGTAASCAITGSAGGNTVTAVVPNGQTLLAGDYFQLGTGSGARLHKVLQNYSGTGSAKNLEIWPALRVNRSGVNAILANTVGVFRLSLNETSWSSNEIANYGITFAAREAI
jgi:hypothetical protein